MNSKFNYYWLLLLVPAVFICWFFIAKKQNKPVTYLPYFGPKHALKSNDTSYHSIPNFTFVDQFNEPVSEKDVAGKIYVTEYFFTTCHSICPIMNQNMERVYAAFKNRPEVLILSHTVDPETDSVPVLAEYAQKHGVKDKRWLFLTGKKTELYGLARKGYLLNAEAGDGGVDDFIHTQNFALVDKDRHIRGFYDGTDSLEVNRLLQEMNVLLKEYEYKERAD